MFQYSKVSSPKSHEKNIVVGNGICELLTFDGLSVPVVLHIFSEYIYISRELDPAFWPLTNTRHT